MTETSVPPGSEQKTNRPLPRSIFPSRAFAIVLFILWLVALAIAFKFDPQASNAIERRVWNPKAHEWLTVGILNKFTLPVIVLRNLVYVTYFAAIFLLWLHPWKGKAMGLLFASGAIGGALYCFIKWVVGRYRPEYHEPYTFHWFTGGIKGLLGAERLSFPSGHTVLAFAMAGALVVCLPKWRVLIFVLATAVALERVLEHSHYPADVVGAMGVGLISAEIALKCFNMLLRGKYDHSLMQQR